MIDQKLYLVLGCGEVGFAVASELKKRGEEPVIIDRNGQKVEHLGVIGYRAFLGDFGSPDVFKKVGIERAKAVLILTSNFSEVRRALDAINQVKTELRINPPTLALVPDEVLVSEARWLGASEVLPSIQTIADAIIDKLEK